MNSEETNIVRKIMLRLSKNPNVRIFRNNIGNAWIGKSVRFTQKQTVSVNPGDVLIYQGRFFSAGLCVGSSDLIGFKSVVITPEMVGKKIAVFLAPEVKTSTGKASQEQVNFLNMVNSMGGIGFVATNEEEAEEFLNHRL
jgi:hypothetical protein